MQLDRTAFLSFNASQGGHRPSAFGESEPRQRQRAEPAPPKKPMAVYYVVGASAAMLQVAIIASATLLLFGNSMGPSYSPVEDPILAAAGMIVASSPNYEVVGAAPKDGKIEIKDLGTGKIASFSTDEIKSGGFKFQNSGGDEVSIEPRAIEKTQSGKPADIAEGMIVYPGTPSKIVSYTASEAVEDGTIEQVTDDPISMVITTFERDLLAAGYTISSKSLDEDAGSIVAERTAPRRIIALDAMLEEGRTRIIIQYAFNAPAVRAQEDAP